MPLLAAEGIHRDYIINAKRLHILKGINLEVNRGEFLVVYGPSGAGKSTLLHIMGLLDYPTRGEVRIADTVFKKWRIRQGRRARVRGRDIGFIFQFYNLLPDFNILENVCLPWMIKKGKFMIQRRLKERAYELLDSVGLSERISHKPGQLSGGEQQRAAVARALINDPGIILADEPTGNLDTENTQRVWSLLSGLKNEHAVVVVTHDEELARRADRTLHLVDGRIV